MFLSSIEVTDNLQLDYVTNSILRTNSSGFVTADNTIPTLTSGNFTPTYTSLTNVTINSTDYGSYNRNGNVIHYDLAVNLSLTLLGGSFRIDLPVARSGNFSGVNQLSNSSVLYNNALTLLGTAPIVTSVSGTQNILVNMPSVSIGTYNLRIMIVYSLS